MKNFDTPDTNTKKNHQEFFMIPTTNNTINQDLQFDSLPATAVSNTTTESLPSTMTGSDACQQQVSGFNNVNEQQQLQQAPNKMLQLMRSNNSSSSYLPSVPEDPTHDNSLTATAQDDPSATYGSNFGLKYLGDSGMFQNIPGNQKFKGDNVDDQHEYLSDLNASSSGSGLGPPRHIPALGNQHLNSPSPMQSNASSRAGTSSGFSSNVSVLSGTTSNSSISSSAYSSSDNGSISGTSSSASVSSNGGRAQSVMMGVPSSLGTSSTSNPRVRKRKKHRKSHLGCQNCKQRRIKCDENLPQCSQCIKYRVDCSYLLLSEPEVTELKRQKSVMAAADVTEQRHKQQHRKIVQAAGGTGDSSGESVMADNNAASLVTPSPGGTSASGAGCSTTGNSNNYNNSNENTSSSTNFTNNTTTINDHPSSSINTHSDTPLYSSTSMSPSDVVNMSNFSAPYSLASEMMDMFDLPHQIPMQQQHRHRHHHHHNHNHSHNQQAVDNQDNNKLKQVSNPHQQVDDLLQSNADAPVSSKRLGDENDLAGANQYLSSELKDSSSGTGSSSNNIPLQDSSRTPLDTPYTNPNSSSQTPIEQHNFSNQQDQNLTRQQPNTDSYNASKQTMWLEGFESAILRTIYEQFIDSVYMMAGSDDILYHAVMSFSFGFLAVRTGNHKLYSHDHRACALRLLQKELVKPTFDNPDSLASAALIMSWDSFFQQDDLKAYVNLSKGVGTVLEKIELSEDNTGVASCMKHALFESIKCVHVPPYGHDFLPELYGHVQSIGHYIEQSMDPILCNQYEALMDFLRYVMGYLQSHTRNVVSVGRHYYSSQFLFNILRQWLQIFPINALSNASVYSEYHQLMYLYYHMVTRVLDALFPEARYIFQFGFVGPVDSVGIDSSFADSLNPNFSSYPLKVLNFFRDRLVRLNTMLAELAPMCLEFPEENIFELCVSSFDTTVLSAQHMPMLLPFVPGSTQTLMNPSQVEGARRRQEDKDRTRGGKQTEKNFFQMYFSDRMAILQN